MNTKKEVLGVAERIQDVSLGLLAGSHHREILTRNGAKTKGGTAEGLRMQDQDRITLFYNLNPDKLASY